MLARRNGFRRSRGRSNRGDRQSPYWNSTQAMLHSGAVLALPLCMVLPAASTPGTLLVGKAHIDELEIQIDLTNQNTNFVVQYGFGLYLSAVTQAGVPIAYNPLDVLDAGRDFWLDPPHVESVYAPAGGSTIIQRMPTLYRYKHPVRITVASGNALVLCWSSKGAIAIGSSGVILNVVYRLTNEL